MLVINDTSLIFVQNVASWANPASWNLLRPLAGVRGQFMAGVLAFGWSVVSKKPQ